MQYLDKYFFLIYNIRGNIYIYIYICIVLIKKTVTIYHKIILVSRNNIAMMLVQKGCDDLHQCSPIIKVTRWFLAKEWTVRIEHCYQEANRVGIA